VILGGIITTSSAMIVLFLWTGVKSSLTGTMNDEDYYYVCFAAADFAAFSYSDSDSDSAGVLRFSSKLSNPMI